MQIEGPGVLEVQRMYDDVVACKCLLATFRKVEVIEECDSRPHEPLRFEVRCKKEPQEVRILKVPKPMPGVSGGKHFQLGTLYKVLEI